MFVRLAFAVAINVNPDILIVDEALAVGDLEFQLKCMENLQKSRTRERRFYSFLMILVRFAVL